MNQDTRTRALAALAAALLVGAAVPPARATTPEQAAPPGTSTIVGGEPAEPGQSRWIASLQSGGHFCGASLVAARWVATAAHCVQGEKAGGLTVWVGGHDLRRPGEGQTAKVKEIFVHPSYDDRTLRNDIALLELEKAISPSIAPAVLANAPQTQQLAKPGSLATVSGWGALSENGRSPNRLHQVRLPIVSKAECNSPAAYDGEILGSQICAGLRQGGKDACQGDSGGPLWVRKADKDFLVGIVSWGEGCAQPRRYGVYTRVAAFKKWAEARMGGGGDPDPTQSGPDPDPQPGASCRGHCGANAGSCWCDAECAALGDCCSDIEDFCEDSPSACTVKVCGVDPYCCDVDWDGLCEDLAARLCT